MTTTQTSGGLIKWLQGLVEREDRGRLAALRRGLLLEPNQFYELYRVVPPQFLEGVDRAEIQRRLMVAILFATHQGSFPRDAEKSRRRRNLGDSLRLLARKQVGATIDSEEGLPEPLKRRLDALLAAPSDELFPHLRQLIRMLKAEEIPVDWEQLLWDLRNWDREDQRVQWQWSRSFYVGEREV